MKNTEKRQKKTIKTFARLFSIDIVSDHHSTPVIVSDPNIFKIARQTESVS